jgi:hypothetical protein
VPGGGGGGRIRDEPETDGPDAVLASAPSLNSPIRC